MAEGVMAGNRAIYRALLRWDFVSDLGHGEPLSQKRLSTGSETYFSR